MAILYGCVYRALAVLSLAA